MLNFGLRGLLIRRGRAPTDKSSERRSILAVCRRLEWPKPIGLRNPVARASHADYAAFTKRRVDRRRQPIILSPSLPVGRISRRTPVQGGLLVGVADLINVGSLHGRPRIWRPAGSVSCTNPIGTVIAGNPVGGASRLLLLPCSELRSPITIIGKTRRPRLALP
jgi:hypothetical protein